MKKIVFLIFLATGNKMYAQPNLDTTIKVDLLRAPSSPASNLLGIATSDIDKPTDVSSFMLSLQSAAGLFTKFPSSYAIDIAPYWLFKNSKKGDITTEGFRKSSGKDVFKQTLVLSLAIKNTDSTETTLAPSSTYGGFGFKFSILRGKYDHTTNEKLNAIKKMQDEKLVYLGQVREKYDSINDPVRDSLKKKQKSLFVPGMTAEQIENVQTGKVYRDIDSILKQRLTDFREQETLDAQNELDEKIKKIASEFQTERIGWTWDIAGGISAEFRNRKLNNSKVYNAGVWTTFGYTDVTYGAGLFLLRLLHNPDIIFAKDNSPKETGDITTFDAGFRYIYAKPQSKFNASLEAIYRSVLSSNTIDPSWRLVFNAGYAIWQNQKLTFSFGRNFDGTTTKDGNLIAALSFLTGFGNKR